MSGMRSAIISAAMVSTKLSPIWIILIDKVTLRPRTYFDKQLSTRWRITSFVTSVPKASIIADTSIARFSHWCSPVPSSQHGHWRNSCRISYSSSDHVLIKKELSEMIILYSMKQ